MINSHRRLLPLLLIVLLAACAGPTPTAAPPTPGPATVPVTTVLIPTTTPPPADTAPPPTPTPPPVVVGYVAGAAGTPGVQQAVAQAAAEFGWAAETGTSADAVRALAAAGAAVVVADGADLEAATAAAAGEFSNTYFVGVNQGGEAGLPNLLTLGGPGSREDQLGFMAGVVAGLLTEGRVVSAVAYTASAEGLRYRNGFLHGVRYTCSRCRVDFIDLADASATVFAAEQARLHASLSADVIFAAAGAAGEAGLQAAAQQGAWVIGAGADAYAGLFGEGTAPGADRVATSVYFDAAAAVRAALAAYQAGDPPTGAQPYSAAAGAVALAPLRVDEDVLTPLDRDDITAALERLASGTLETGINPVTGDEL